MPRFVLLLHDCTNDRPRPTHCDLMLETGAALQTWSLQQLPRDWLGLESAAELRIFASSNTVEAEQLADHRLAYLDYEGPVSGDRGSVRRLDAGTIVSWKVPFEYSLDGQVIRGKISLQQTSPSDAQWWLSYLPTIAIAD